VSATVAWVSGDPLKVSDVDELEAGLRSGPVAATLPRPGTREGRQLRRWLVQVLAAERLVAQEARVRGLGADGAPPLVSLAPDRAALLALGSVAADLLTRSALARRVFAAVTEEVSVDAKEVERFYRANPEAYRVPEERVVRSIGPLRTSRQGEPTGPDEEAFVSAESRQAAVDPAEAQTERTSWRGELTGPEAKKGVAAETRVIEEHVSGPLRTLRRGELTGAVEDAVFAARAGEVVGPVEDPLGRHTYQVVEVRVARVRALAEVRAEIEGRLRSAARRRAFTAWLDGCAAARVRLSSGFEHPGDPRQPDNTHRH
jgi:[acyl-carrier-protein] S-malonyltransferase